MEFYSIFHSTRDRKADILEREATQQLHAACAEGNVALVKELGEKGVDLSARDDYSKTALHIACEKGHLKIVQYLSEAGAELDAKVDGSITPLYVALKNNHVAIVNFLLTKLNVFSQVSMLQRAVTWPRHTSLIWLLLNNEEFLGLLHQVDQNNCNAIHSSLDLLKPIESKNRAPQDNLERTQIAQYALIEIINEIFIAKRGHAFAPDAKSDFEKSFNEQKKHFLGFFENRNKIQSRLQQVEILYSSSEPMLDRIPYLNPGFMHHLRTLYQALYIPSWPKRDTTKSTPSKLPLELLAIIMGYYVETAAMYDSSIYMPDFKKFILPYLPEDITVFDKAKVGAHILHFHKQFISSTRDKAFVESISKRPSMSRNKPT